MRKLPPFPVVLGKPLLMADHVAPPSMLLNMPALAVAAYTIEGSVGCA